MKRTAMSANNMKKFKMQFCCVMFVFLVGLFLAASVKVNAQDDKDKIRVETNLVLINVLVQDKNGQFVRGLTPEQFEVYDDDAKRPIDSFSAEGAPVSFGIIYDMHPTTEERTKSVVESLRQFKNDLLNRDDLSFAAFNMRGLQAFEFIPTFEQLEKHMADPDKRELNSLYDAVFFGSDRLQTSRFQKRVLLIISDSADHHSRHTLSEVWEKVGEIQAEVYAVIFDDNDVFAYGNVTHKGGEFHPFFKDASQLDRAAMRDLTLRSGGGTYLGGSENASRLFTIYKQIASEVGAYYTLGFYPDGIDDKRHDVRIRLRGVKGSKGFALTYRLSYQNRAKPVNQ